MEFSRAIITAVEQSRERVTVADIAAKSGLGLDLAQRELTALAATVGGHLEVAETGDLVYRFPGNIWGILRAQSWRLRLQQAWAKIWGVLFFLLRISFGVILIASLMLIVVAIVAIAIAAMTASNSNRDSNSSSRSSSSASGSLNLARLLIYFNYWVGPDWYWWLQPRRGYRRSRPAPRQSQGRAEEPKLSFLEAVFSFLFGDGDPNAELEAQRWQAIATVIRNQGGAVAAEQLVPYLEVSGQDVEEAVLPVLVRFNGYPEVTEQGELIYAFPDLQVTAQAGSREPVRAYLHETPWEFSAATRSQLGLAAGLGFANLTGAVLLGWLLWFEGYADLGGVVGLAAGLYGLLATYAIAFLAIPGLRYLWLQRRNARIAQRNQQRQARAEALLQPDATLQHKLAAARQLEIRRVIGTEDLAYSTEQDLLDQELAQADKIDQEWQQRLAENDR